MNADRRKIHENDQLDNIENLTKNENANCRQINENDQFEEIDQNMEKIPCFWS